jgi:hypothetical protein
VPGILLTSTGCGAVLGLPMILMALPATIWGTVWCFQGQSQRAQEAIAAGVRQGIQQGTPVAGLPVAPEHVTGLRPSELAGLTETPPPLEASVDQ